GEEGLPVAQGQKQFLVMLAKVLPAFDKNESKLASVRALVQVIHGHRMRVVPPAARRPRSELEPPLPVWRYRRRTLFLRAVHLGWNQHAVPVHKLWRIRSIDHIDRDRLSLLHPQHRSRCCTVVTDG